MSVYNVETNTLESQRRYERRCGVEALERSQRAR